MANMEYCISCKKAVIEWPSDKEYMLADMVYAEFLCGECGEEYELILIKKDKK